MLILVLDHFDKNLSRNKHWLESLLSDLAKKDFRFKSAFLQTALIDQEKINIKPDLIIMEVGSLSQLAEDLKIVNKMYSHAPVLQIVDSYSLTDLQESLQLGVSDFIMKSDSDLILASKLLVHTNKVRVSSSSRMILVDSGKGGVGVTTVVAALAELAVDAGKKTLIIDLDIVTQDLSRFLHCRPYVNEILSSIFLNHISLNAETFEQSFNRVWSDNELLYCMTPAVISEVSNLHNLITDLINRITDAFDCVIVDLANFPVELLSPFVEKCSEYVLVSNNDLASFYPVYERYNYIKNKFHNRCSVNLIINEISFLSMTAKDSIKELSGLMPNIKKYFTLNFDPDGAWWLASGGTLYSLSGRRARLQLEIIAAGVFGIRRELKQDWRSFIFEHLSSLRKKPQKIELKQLPQPKNTSFDDCKDLVTQPVWS